MMEVYAGSTKIVVEKGDITEQETDAIVNAANPTLLGGGGVDGAIHRRGGPDIQEECKTIRKTSWPEGLPIGKSVVSSAGRLKAKKVIHTVGPVWSGGDKGEPELLAQAYKNSLDLALRTGLRRISFPSISTGAYGYPVEKASRVALGTVVDFLKKNEGIDEVRFVLHSNYDLQIYKEALTEIFGNF